MGACDRDAPQKKGASRLFLLRSSRGRDGRDPNRLLPEPISRIDRWEKELLLLHVEEEGEGEGDGDEREEIGKGTPPSTVQIPL